MNNKEKRFLELTFWLFCKDFTDKTGDIQTLYQFIDIIKHFTSFSSITVQRLAYQTLMEQQYKPDKEELVTLLKEMNYAVRAIKSYAKIGTDKLYELLENNKRDPRGYYPKHSTEEHIQMQKFLEAIKIFKKLGV